MSLAVAGVDPCDPRDIGRQPGDRCVERFGGLGFVIRQRAVLADGSDMEVGEADAARPEAAGCGRPVTGGTVAEVPRVAQPDAVLGVVAIGRAGLMEGW